MSWQDRPYNREEDYQFGSGEPQRRGGFGPRLGKKSFVTWLIVINAVVFILDQIFTGSMRASALSFSYWGNFNVEQAIYGGQVWRFFTYQFIHANLLHIAFNMIGLYFFGPLMEQHWGSRRFLAFYLLCGMSGAVLMSLFVLTIPAALGVGPNSMLVGASGSLFGILAACAVLFPKMRVQLIIPPVPMTMRTMAMVFLGIAVLVIIVGGNNAGGQAAHLGGALLGFLLVKAPFLLDWADRVSPREIQNNINAGRFERKQKQQRAKEQEVDRILDKVKREGLASLTSKERKTLNQASEQMRD